MRVVLAAVVACGAVLTAGVAVAEDRSPLELVEVDGAARMDEDDPRAVAVDAAFARAVEEAVAVLVPPGMRSQYRVQIRDGVVRRARLYVARYRVQEEGDDGTTYRVRIAAWVDVAKLRGALADVGVRLDAPAVAPVVDTRARPRLLVLVRTAVGETVLANYGRYASDGGPVGVAVATEMTSLGFDLVSAAGVPIPVEATPASALSDVAVAEMARTAGAGGAVVVDASLGADGRVRGTALLGAVGSARVRVLSVTDTGVARVAADQVEAAAFAEAANLALDAASRALGLRGVGAVAAAAERYWPPAVIAPGNVVIEVRGAPTWSVVREIWRAVAKAPGVSAVTPRVLRRGYVAFEISTGQQAGQVARALASATFRDATVSVQTVDAATLIVDVTPAPVGVSE